MNPHAELCQVLKTFFSAIPAGRRLTFLAELNYLERTLGFPESSVADVESLSQTRYLLTMNCGMDRVPPLISAEQAADMVGLKAVTFKQYISQGQGIYATSRSGVTLTFTRISGRADHAISHGTTPTEGEASRVGSHA